MWLFLAFLAVPLIEIALFIQIGGAIGLWATLAIVIITAMLGTVLVRSQGLQTLENLKGSLSSGRDPSRDMAHGAMILFSGALLLTPGFFTDAVGFALMVPGIRDTLFQRIKDRVVLQTSQMQFDQSGQVRPGPAGRSASSSQTVIDGEFEEIDPNDIPPKPTDRPSGWTRDRH